MGLLQHMLDDEGAKGSPYLSKLQRLPVLMASQSLHGALVVVVVGARVVVVVVVTPHLHGAAHHRNDVCCTPTISVFVNSLQHLLDVDNGVIGVLPLMTHFVARLQSNPCRFLTSKAYASLNRFARVKQVLF